MKNSNENLILGTWLLTFLHQNALFYYKNSKIFSAPAAETYFEGFAGCVLILPHSATFCKSATFALSWPATKKLGGTLRHDMPDFRWLNDTKGGLR